VALALILTAPAANAAAATYRAERFDVDAKAVDGGLDVTETIVFEFQSGTFHVVWREIPADRTDGIQILDAAMDGASMTRGDGPGHFSVTGRNRVRVEWHFAETGASRHRFDLHYVARGVAYRDGDSDLVRWRPLPSEHRYRIDASRVQFEPAGASVAPLETHRVGSARVQTSSETIVIEASDIQPNGSIVAELRYQAGRLAAADPAWRTRTSRARELGPEWAKGGAVIGILALLIVLLVRRSYPAPPPFPDQPSAEPPEALPAALAAALVAKGRAAGYQPIGTILDLADRGVLTVTEVPVRFGPRAYTLAQVPGTHDLAAHEETALRIAFAHDGEDVSFARARGRLARRSRQFAEAVNADLLDKGLIDPERKTVRDRLSVIALTMLPAAALGAAAVAPLIPTYDAWPFLLPLGLLVAGIVGMVLAATLTPLSDQGLMEGARWRGFKRQLKTLASQDDTGGGVIASRWIVYAMAFGLGFYWSRYLKRHPGIVPAWFVSESGHPDAAFAAFVGTNPAYTSHGGAAGAGAAGGGGSGAA
jgi:hypothetical protein